MKVVILCGGTGTRLREETEFRPKPMIPIGGMPMVVHIMKLYAHYGFNEFVLALGYKQEIVKEYFAHYDIINNDITVDIGGYRGDHYIAPSEHRWKVTMSDTGEETFKGARLKMVEKYIDGDTFMCTYGDGIGNIDIPALLAFHKSHGKLATVTGIHPIPRFGEIYQEQGHVLSFTEKPIDGKNLVNGGFFVFNREIFNYLYTEPWCDLEIGPLELVAQESQLMVYEHRGFWKCMDTLKDMGELNILWNGGDAPWKVWK